MIRVLTILWAITLITFGANRGLAICPFCTAAGQTLRQEMLSMDVVGIATLVSDGRDDIDGAANFKMESLLKGDSLVKVGQVFQATYFGPGKSTKRFLMQGVDPRDLVWSSPVPLSGEAEQYIVKLTKLPEDPIERLDFFQQYFEHPDALLSRDCYDEFALSPYDEIVRLKSKMKREKLIAWCKDPKMAPDRKRLYYTMLGVCGLPEDVQWMESMIKSTKAEDRVGLDSLIAAYLNLHGDAGLPLIVESILKNKDSQYVDIFAAVMALRFHSTEGVVLKKEAVAKSMCTLLDRPDLADLIIPDLARMEEWTQVDKLFELFRDAKDEYVWIRMPIVNYMRACPLPEAKDKIAEMEKIDPAAVKRSKTFFPIPVPAGPKKGPTSWNNPPLRQAGLLAQSDSEKSQSALLLSRIEARRTVRVVSLPGAEAPELALYPAIPNLLNQQASLAVVMLATLTFGSVLWCLATAGR